MTFDALRELCLSLPGTSEKMPFASFPTGQNIICFYVGSKIFCLTNLDKFEYFNLKGDPEENVELCERYMSITPGWHMNKQHWITVNVPGDAPDKLIEQLVRRSYDLVLASLPRKERATLISKYFDKI